MDRGTVESLERGFDRLHGLVQRVARRQAIAMPANAIARFEGLVSGDVYAPTDETVAPVSEAPDAATAPAVAAQEAAAPPAPRPPPPPRPLPRFDDEDITARAPQEMIRVRSDLL